jgi:hypothetical protein
MTRLTTLPSEIQHAILSHALQNTYKSTYTWSTTSKVYRKTGMVKYIKLAIGLASVSPVFLNEVIFIIQHKLEDTATCLQELGAEVENVSSMSLTYAGPPWSDHFERLAELSYRAKSYEKIFNALKKIRDVECAQPRDLKEQDVANGKDTSTSVEVLCKMQGSRPQNATQTLDVKSAWLQVCPSRMWYMPLEVALCVGGRKI